MNFFQPDIYSYLLVGPIKESYQRLIRFLQETGVKPYHIFDLADLSAESVSIEIIRNLKQKVVLRPIGESDILYFIVRGRQLGDAAQNSLLKLLEEPPQYLRNIIICQNSKEILPTVASRCTIVYLSQARETGGIRSFSLPAIAKTPLADLFRQAEKLPHKRDINETIDGWILTNCSNQVMTEKRRKICGALLAAKKMSASTNVNRRLLLDNLFLKLKYDL